MNLNELLRIIWINVKQNRAKVMLNSLGIIVGTITIILVIGIGKGGENEAAKQFSGISADTLYLKPDYGAVLSEKNKNTERLTKEIIEKILGESTSLKGMYLRQTINTEIKIGKEKVNVTVSGVSESYAQVSNLTFVSGDNLTEEHYEKASNVAVLGYNIAKTYFKGIENAVGQTVLINQKRYKVIGVLSRTGDGLHEANSSLV